LNKQPTLKKKMSSRSSSSRRDRSPERRSSSSSRKRARSRSTSPRRSSKYDKSRETPEERRARRLAKKQAKQRKRDQAPEAEVARQMGYSNDNNPFGDSNLNEKFVWKAKRDKLKKQGVDPIRAEKERERARRVELKDEISKVKARRDERAVEKELWEREQRRLQLERELGSLEDWEKQEEKFHLEQARKRSAIRLQEGRGKAIDRLYKNVAGVDDLDFDVREPQRIFDELSSDELRELRKDIDTYISIDGDDPEHLRFWQALAVVCDDMLAAGSVPAHRAVLASIGQVLNGKSARQLAELRVQIREKLAAPDEGVDVEYWQSLLARLEVQLARATLSEMHMRLLEARLERLEAADAAAADDDDDDDDDDDVDVDNNNTNDTNDNTTSATAVAATTSTTSTSTNSSSSTAASAEEERLAAEAIARAVGAMEEAGEDEEKFEDVVELPSQTYSWTDRYRPRKPMYFNKISAGYHWNSYNRTHFDHDNPPPKQVQGYKFSIAYPMLIDKSKAPTYRLLPADTPDKLLLVFSAGPPYEDIAFKIVNAEWATGKRSGFRCKFQNGVLQLHFNLKFYRYRK